MDPKKNLMNFVKNSANSVNSVNNANSVNLNTRFHYHGHVTINTPTTASNSKLNVNGGIRFIEVSENTLVGKKEAIENPEDLE